ncbi:SYP43 [Linum perenne]
MATRNRTVIFRKYRDALKSVRIPTSSSSSAASTSSSGGGGGGPVIELVSTSLLNHKRSYAPLSTEDPGNFSKGALTVGLPPAWVDISEDIATNVQRARTKMAELARAHAKALMPSFGDDNEDQYTIETLTQEITGLIKRSEKKLQRLSAGGPAEDSNVRKNVQRSLATDLQNLSMELRKKQSTYLKRLRLQNEGQDGDDLEMNLNGNRSRMDDDDGLGDMMFNELQTARVKKSEAFTAEREREIQQASASPFGFVVESVNELAQIMKDLSVLVIDQGTIVDRIDHNIQNVATTVEDGLKQLQKAERTQKQGGMVMCATVLVIMCFIMLVLLILKEILF